MYDTTSEQTLRARAIEDMTALMAHPSTPTEAIASALELLARATRRAWVPTQYPATIESAWTDTYQEGP